MHEGLIGQLNAARVYFTRSTSCLSEEDSGYRPSEDMFTVAQQVAHVAQTVDWFFDGAFNQDGFDMDFEAHEKELLEATSLTAAREWFDRAIDNGAKVLAAKTDEELHQSLPEGPIMGGLPRVAILGGISDHTAHHRGVLTAYSRMLGKIPPMPYMDA